MMGALMRSHDWAATPVGSPETWPQGLKTTVRLLLTSRHPMFIWWGQRLTCFYNDAYSMTLGPDRHPSMLGCDGREAWAEIWDVIGPDIEHVMAGHGATWHERQLVPITRGECREDVWWTYGYSPIDDESVSTAVGGVLVICQDKTAEVRADQAHADEARRLRQLFEQAPGFIAMLRGPNHVFELTNASYVRFVGREVLGKPVREGLPELEGQGFFELLDQVYATGVPFTARRRLVKLASGPDSALDQRYVSFVYQPVYDASGAVSGIFIEGSDVTEASLAMEALEASQAQLREANTTLEQRVVERTAALRANEARLRAIFETSYQLQGLLATDGALLEANATALAVIEATLPDVVGKPFWETPWFTGTPGMPDRVRAGVATAARGETVRFETTVTVAAGLRSYDFSMRPIHDPEGRIIAIVPEAVDITDRREAEQSLHQAQKMEAVGQLTGGIAHDFNNMLQAIGSSLDLMSRRLEQGRIDELPRFVEGASKTVERAAALTHQLLAFARRQTLQPKPVVVDSLIGDLIELMRRTVTPAITVDLQMHDGIWPVLCDRNQLENVLLNLSINARDAMPDGGRLTIRTKHVHLLRADVTEQDGAEPGDYVEIAVADTGIGMDEATRARAFEPFFTTKPTGQGTGLGLSQLYGFIRQSNGIVQLDSAPGQGTTVRLYLPRHHAMQAVGAQPTANPAAEPNGASETVMLVEDEEGVLAIMSEYLRDLGYAILPAKDGAEALQLMRSGTMLDLLVTDVGLPNGMNGRQVADAARGHWPDLPVLFITGYAGSALDEQLAPGMEVIGKPFTLDSLTERMRALLDS